MKVPSVQTVKARLLADPSLINVRRAAARLLAARFHCSEPAADFHLSDFKRASDINKTFERVLPDVYEREKGSLFDRARAFFDAIDNRFPVDWQYLDEEYMQLGDDEASYFDLGIMVTSMRPFHAWRYREEWEEIPLAFRLADMLFDFATPGNPADRGVKAWAYFARNFGLAEELKPQGKYGEQMALSICFEEHKSPLKYLPLAVQVLNYSTGCLFYDYDEEDGPPDAWEWSKTSVDYLTAQGKLGLDIRGKLKRLDNWLEAKPAARVAQACRLFKKFSRMVRDNDEAIQRITAAPAARALVDVL